MDLAPKALLRRSIGNDHQKWVRDTQIIPHCGASTVSPSQMESGNNLWEIAGSSQLFLHSLKIRKESTDSSTTKNTTIMVPSDSTSGSKMHGLVSTLMIGCQATSGVEASDHGLLRDQEAKLGGCPFWRKLTQNLIKTTIELLEAMAMKLFEH